MPRRLLFDQLHLDVYVPPRLPAAEADRMTRTLNGVRFQKRLKRAVVAVFRRERSLRTASLVLSG